MRPLRRSLALAATTAVLVSTGLTTGLASASASTSSGVNDYPFRRDVTQQADPWGFTKRQCVSFVAWRENQRHHPMNNATQHWGSAYNWNNAAAKMGVKIGRKPVVGAIAQWNEHERSSYYSPGSTRVNGYMLAGEWGHVGYVRKVYRDGSVLIENYNMGSARSYSRLHVKAPRYIYWGVKAPR